MKRFLKTAFKVFLFLFVVVVLLAAWALGILKPSELKTQTKNAISNTKREATQFVTEGGTLSGNAIDCANACRGNLRRIESAKRSLHSRGMFATGSVSWDAVVKEMGGKAPKCPCGGTYRLGTLEMLPTCSISANGTAAPDDDHIIKQY